MNARHIRASAWLAVLLLGVLSCGGALGAPVWTCAITSAFQCDDDGTVGPPDLGGLARPTFLRVDANTKAITILAPDSRRGEVTKIGTVVDGKDLWLFSGIEDGRAWSLVINAEGHMTLSVASDGATWSVFGNAMQERVNSADE
ncbi:MAG: hypothetical protein K8T26_12330 [Lentisphaerae bacterium]|nr:hypothetical protein [Lentisphaerota bacterium]